MRERDRIYEINGAESRMLATVGAFRVVAERAAAVDESGLWLTHLKISTNLLGQIVIDLGVSWDRSTSSWPRG